MRHMKRESFNTFLFVSICCQLVRLVYSPCAYCNGQQAQEWECLFFILVLVLHFTVCSECPGCLEESTTIVLVSFHAEWVVGPEADKMVILNF